MDCHRLLNGLIVQWGVIVQHSNQGVSITFPIPFSNTNYYVNEMPFKTSSETGNPYDSNYRRQAHTKKVSSVEINDFCAFQDFKISWFAIGF